jgi:hypothetical protein
MLRLPLLQPTFLVTSTRDQHHFWRLSAAPSWENPPTATSRGIVLRSVAAFSAHAALDHLAVIQPPTAPCLTARGRLRADWPPRFSVPVGTVGESTAALSAVGRSAKTRPSDTFIDDGAVRLAPGCPSPAPASARARQCTGFFELRVPSIDRDHRELSRFGWRASFAGRRIRRCTCSSLLESFD